jgi:hypothetical protein
MLVDFSAKERGYLSCTPGAGQKGKRKEKKKRKENAPLVIPSMSLASSNRRLRIPLSI